MPVTSIFPSPPRRAGGQLVREPVLNGKGGGEKEEEEEEVEAVGIDQRSVCVCVFVSMS